jgi:hypothetical protein
MMKKSKKIQRKIKRSFHFYYFTLLAAIALSSIAAYFSIYGLSALFSASKQAVIIMAIGLEFGKIIAISAYYRFKHVLLNRYKSYLLFATIFLMGITSLGIYSYLSNSFQSNSNIIEINEKNEDVLKNQIGNIDTNIKNINIQNDFLNKRYDSLIKRRENQDKRLDTSTRSMINFTKKDIDNSNEEIKNIDNQRVELNKKMNSFIEEKRNIELQILDLSKKNINVDVGPLKYIGKLFNIRIDKVVNILIIVIIVTFDPLAVMFFIISNIAMMKREVKYRKKRKYIRKNKKNAKKVKIRQLV